MAAITICTDFGAQKIKSDTVTTVSPSICYEFMGTDSMIFVFWMSKFKTTFSLPSFTFIKRLFCSSLLSVIWMVTSTFLRLLIFLQEVMIPACASSSPAFLMMYSAYKLNKQGDTKYILDIFLSQLGTSLLFHIQFWLLLLDLHTNFSRDRSGGLVVPSLEEFSTVCCDPHSQTLCIVNKAEIDAFLELSCFFKDPENVGNLISGSSAFSKTSLYIWKFSVRCWEFWALLC